MRIFSADFLVIINQAAAYASWSQWCFTAEYSARKCGGLTPACNIFGLKVHLTSLQNIPESILSGSISRLLSMLHLLMKVLSHAGAKKKTTRLKGLTFWAISTFSLVGSLSSNGLRMRVCVCSLCGIVRSELICGYASVVYTSSSFPPPTQTHTHTHTNTHTHTHTHTHTRTHARTHARSHARTHAHTHTI